MFKHSLNVEVIPCPASRELLDKQVLHNSFSKDWRRLFWRFCLFYVTPSVKPELALSSQCNLPQAYFYPTNLIRHHVLKCPCVHTVWMCPSGGSLSEITFPHVCCVLSEGRCPERWSVPTSLSNRVSLPKRVHWHNSLSGHCHLSTTTTTLSPSERAVPSKHCSLSYLSMLHFSLQ